MKMILMSFVLLASGAASAQVGVSNLELAGDCKPAVEAMIQIRVGAKVQIESVQDLGRGDVLVRSVYALDPSKKAPLVRATLGEVKTLARVQKVFAIQCKVYQAAVVRGF